MLTSEDLEVLSHIQQSPWEIWYNPDMELGHKIPHWRLERASPHCFDSRHWAESLMSTRTIGVSPTMKPVLTVAYMANDLRKVLLHLLKYGTAVKTDLAAACELELYLTSLASPFYLWKNGYLKEKQTEK
ncbi:MAG: hypothetical protein HC925_09110 [Coleofasciculaceae cyanobacterium SM2_3_26]|nr:hypothetical protein [Coleofasciculaceae cyanobacterium SM2_3_26]